MEREELVGTAAQEVEEKRQMVEVRRVAGLGHPRHPLRCLQVSQMAPAQATIFIMLCPFVWN